MNQTLELCRIVYNGTFATRKNAWEQEQKSISNYDTHNILASWKSQYPELKTVYSQVLQEVQQRVDLAFKAFFRRVKAGEKAGYPRFRGKGRYDSFAYTQSGFALDGSSRTVRLSKIGGVKIKLHRPLDGTIKRLNVSRRSTGKWFACFTVEHEPEPRAYKDGAMIGVDVGLTSFATLSNGEHIENPRIFKQEEKALAKALRKLSAQEKWTAQRAKARKLVARVHERIANHETILRTS